MDQRFPPNLIQPLLEFLSIPRKIVITTHHRPDGDAMGSSLGLYTYLKSKGHSPVVVTPSDYPSFLNWLPSNDTVINYEYHQKQGDELIRNAELIFCLDFNWMSRVESMEPALRNSKAVKVLIDHHLDPEDAFQFVFSYTDACSTCELIYNMIVAFNDTKLISKDIAESLYCGIMTDTNSFRYSNMKADTHRIIAKLMEAGAENYKIHERIYDVNSENRLRLLGFSLKDKLTILPEFNTAYLALSESELKMFNFKSGDSEGFVNYALSIEGIRVAAFFTEKDGIVKISFRSKGDFSVKELSSAHFEGGGHKNASGGRSLLSLDDTVKKFIDILSIYKSKLTS